MVIWLTRTYFPEGTNGKLECEGKTIELPWKMNETKVSCVPEGKYFIRKQQLKRKISRTNESRSVLNSLLIMIWISFSDK